MHGQSPSHSAAGLPAAVILCVSVLLASLLGIWSRPLGQLAAFWPANAFLLGLLVRFPRLASRYGWCGAVVGYLMADLVTGGELFRTVLLTGANLAGVAVGYVLFRRLREDDRRLRGAFSILYLLITITAASAAAGLVGAAINPILFGESSLLGMLFWFVTEFVNFTTVLPMLLTLPSFSRPFIGRRKFRILGWAGIVYWLPALLLVLSCALAVVVGGPGAVAFPIPALLWCAMTYSVFFTTVLTFFFSAWALLSIKFGYLEVTLGGIHSQGVLLSLRIGVMLVALGPINVATVMAARNELLRKLQHMASHDQLSGLLNRRAFNEQSALVLQGMQSKRRPVAVLMMDIDHFKKVNDTYGHAGGDQVLVAFSRLASACLRDGDILGRLGGEEFAIVLANCAHDDACAIADRIRTSFGQTPVALDTGAQAAVTLSIGVAFAGQGDVSLDVMLLAADKALYRAKESGRNRVEVYRFDSPENALPLDSPKYST